MFDIQRTCREVHDHARRFLHNNGILPAGPAINLNDQRRVMREGIADPEGDDELIQTEVEKRIDEMVCCKICMDKTIDSLFATCGHVVSCMDCAKK